MGASLDDEGKFSVYYISGGYPVQRFVTISHDQTKQYIHLTPLQFLRLLEWGEGQRPVLRELVETEGAQEEGTEGKEKES